MKYEIYIGGDNITKKRCELNTISKMLWDSGISGATLTKTHGIWIGESEESWKVEIINNSSTIRENIGVFILLVKTELKQNAILVFEHRGELKCP